MSYNLGKHVDSLLANQHKWLVTGVAGFIGSNLLEYLLSKDQIVIGLDNFSTGKASNLEDVKKLTESKKWKNFQFLEGDISNYEDCFNASKNIDFVLHQAALGSVPRSLMDPISSNNANVNGFLNILNAAKENKVKSFTYAASSSTYGDSKKLPKSEDEIGRPLSPYAVTKYVNELYAEVYSRSYDFNCIGLRYFNVFGKRQDPDGAYAAVIPKWAGSMVNNEDIYINGDGETSRDFCFIDNVIQANILSSFADQKNKNHVYNIALGKRTTLNKLSEMIKNSLKNCGINSKSKKIYRDFRPGDVRHSQADISKAIDRLKYQPLVEIEEGIENSMKWYSGLYGK